MTPSVPAVPDFVTPVVYSVPATGVAPVPSCVSENLRGSEVFVESD